MRWLCLILPKLALETLPFSVPVEEPLVICHSERQRTMIWLANDAAQALGVHRGMSLAMAQALVGQLTIFTRTPRTETLALQQVATLAMHFSSDVQLTQGGAVLLEIERSALLYGSPSHLLNALQQAIATLGYSVQIQMAWGSTAALVLSSLPAQKDTDPKSLQAFLRCASLRCLRRDARVPAKWLEHGQQLGLRSIGDLLDLPRAALGRRFGQEILDYLARLSAEKPDQFEPFRLPDSFEQGIELPRETDNVEALLFPIRRLLQGLELYLRTRQKAVNRLQILLGQHRSAPQPVVLGTAIPSWLASTWLDMCKLRLERQPLLAPVLDITIKADRFVDLTPARKQLFANQEEEQDNEAQLLNVLRARLGDNAVQVMAADKAWWPEQAMSLSTMTVIPNKIVAIRARAAWPATSANAAGNLTANTTVQHATQTINNTNVMPSLELPLAERPLSLLATPQPLKMHNRQLQYRGTLVFEPGIELLHSDWWQQVWSQREYRVARNAAGERFWLFRDNHAPEQWYLHGLLGCGGSPANADGRGVDELRPAKAPRKGGGPSADPDSAPLQKS